MSDKRILRKLAATYAEFAFSDKNNERMNLHTQLNDLQPLRPILLIDEFPWHELNFDGSLTLECTNPQNHEIETLLRRKIMQWKYFSADMVLEREIPIMPITTGLMDIGVLVKDEHAVTDENNEVVGHYYHNQFQSIEDLEKLHNSKIVYHESETKEKCDYYSEIFDGIIPVKMTGYQTGYMIGNITWDIISMYMGVNDLLFNLLDNPKFMHAFVRKLTDIFMDRINQLEQLNLLDGNALYCHCASALSNDLKKKEIIDGKITRKNVWGRGLAQILTSVSPDMHDEFDIDYMIQALGGFGLNYYGCCEALDKKIDIVKKIPNLRKISISPWADMHLSAQQIRNDYVMSAKPNPAILGGTTLDVDMAKKEINNIVKAAQKNNCPLELLMKDISTVGYNIDNLIKWTELVMSIIN